MLIIERCKEKLQRHMALALKLLIPLGFLINLKKSILIPFRELEFLGSAQ